ncbi:MAG TPA: ABC transporter ATP-binding protein [Polyangiaceae bacterium]|nr:ABC transporter ATP-binding protein [Polyangiaceae bacterium]
MVAAPLIAPLIEVQDVERHYSMGGEVIAALAGVSFAIHPGEFVAIVGSSGSGKSTLMNLLGCLDTPSRGIYRLRGHDVRSLSDDALSDLRNREIGFIFQNFQLLPRASALENVALPLVYRGVRARERRELARRALERVGLAHRASHKPTELSGGQRQRVSIARALVAEPSLLLADEPTGNLDTATGRDILRLFDELHAAGNTLVVVTHEPEIAARCPRSIRLSDGRIVEDRQNAPAEHQPVLGARLAVPRSREPVEDPAP